MTAAQPKVSVLMSVLDGEEYLAEAMDSILGQDFTDFEFVIVDNASTDRTAEIIASYGDHRIVTITNSETLNLSQSLNRGLVAARGDYVARLDADRVVSYSWDNTLKVWSTTDPRRHMAASQIHRHWRDAISNPQRKLCRKWLQRQCES